MRLPYYYFFFFRFVPRRFSGFALSRSLILSLSLSLSVHFCILFFLPITRHVVFQLDSLWLYVYVSRGNMIRFYIVRFFILY